MKIHILFLFLLFAVNLRAMPLINVDHRETVSLNGKWSIVIDPYQMGYYDYRYQPSANGFFKNEKPQKRWERVEYSFDTDLQLNVPGDWNSQKESLYLYEGTIWYQNYFQVQPKPDERLFLYFGAVNYHARVYLNGEKLGEHIGGFTPFHFEITDQVKAGKNDLILMVDNTRHMQAVPTVNTDWFNYGGITRRVMLVRTHETFIRDYRIQLDPENSEKMTGFVQLDGVQKKQKIEIHIPEAGIREATETDADGRAEIQFNHNLKLWSPETPKLYDVIIKTETYTLSDRIGFRSIGTEGTSILLNGEPVYLRGICIHEEAPYEDGSRAFSEDHARILLGWAKDLGCNFVRLAHYPHNEWMTRVADELGLMLWSEIPVYWTIQWKNQHTYENAENQLTEMINRDKNRASVILWSMANETPLSEARLDFLTSLAQQARALDPTRLLTAAMERHYTDEYTLLIDDPFGEVVDVLGCNEYIGWYDGLPAKCDSITWTSAYNKPVIISEFGAGALYNMHGDSLTRWSEEFQASVYRHNIDMLNKVDFIQGMTPWILKDFRSPRRPLPRIQDFWNRKGLISDQGQRKLAFYELQKYYKCKAE
ncbi:MAG: glycoside hydrolase family 2 TIM barrel-domain containing protein [candidate division KSB1 bacterium]|nr:glycoside hydrolase family 2 TIM barrel-domain containing protein [candidate division KSB1 bacterium]